MRMSWTDDLIASHLINAARGLQRMPSANELRALGQNALAMAVSRRGGFRYWAERLNLPLKGTETHRGQAVETHVAAYLVGLGFDVKSQTTRAPFDMLIDGCVRVDVKSARYGDYIRKDARKRTPQRTKGFAFGLNKVPPTCDLYVLCGVDEGNTVLWRYFVPATEARVRMLIQPI